MAELTGSAPAKLLLFGEHAAVHGYPALGTSVPWRARVEVSAPSPADRSERAVEPLPAGLRPLFADRPPDSLITISSEVPIGLGFGSSASLCVAAERARQHPPREPDQLWQAAHERERAFHGAPSGADTGLVVHEGIGYLRWRAGQQALPRYTPLHPRGDLHIVVAAVPRGRDTKALVAAVGERARAEHGPSLQALAALGALSEEARAVLDEQSAPATALAALADRAHAHLAALGLAVAAQERVLQAGRAAGAAGGKLSGAGGGGACYLVCADAQVAARVMQAVAAEAPIAAHARLTADGVQLIAAVAPSSVSSGCWRR